MPGAYYNEFDLQAAAWLRELIKAGHIPEGEVDERSITEVRADDLRGYRSVHLFAGIGGWPYALRLAGWPDERPVWTGSCPCPPFSAAGKKKSCPECQSREVIPHPYQTGIFACVPCGHEWFADGRHLWPEFHRLLAECRPSIVFGEQVAGSDGEVWLAGVRATLERIGYGVGAANLAAGSVGAPHIRQRLFWVADAHPGRCEDPRPIRDERRQSRPCCGCESCQLADPEGQRRRTGRVGEPSECGADEPERLCDALRVGNSSMPGLGTAERSNRPAAVELVPELSGDAAGVTQGDTSSPGPQGRSGVAANEGPTAPAPSGPGFWDAFDLIPCRDGKHRRIPARSAEPGLQPVVDGFPSVVDGVRNRWLDVHPLTAAKVEGRVGLLKGAGNAIVPEVAAEFVRAWLEVSGT